MTYTLVCPCVFGLEKTVAFELKKCGGENVRCENGRVLCEGDALVVARANLQSRCAERVLLLMAEFEAHSFEDLYQGTKAVNWADYIPQNGAFPVKGWSLNSQLTSIPDCQSIVKKAMVDKLKETYDVFWFAESGETYQVQFGILKDRVQLMMDTSGEGLHKRGYRKYSGGAPIKETLAAGIVDLSRIREGDYVFDPCCGSGTLLIEAALKALNIAPGLYRSFSCEKWKTFDQNAFMTARKEAITAINKDAEFEAYGYDIDPAMVKLTLENAKHAGVERCIKAEVCDIAKNRIKDEGGILLCNPPYGERMLEKTDARKLYKDLGVFVQNNQFKSYVITSDEEFERHFGAKADRKRKLYNGELKCQLYMYYK